MLSTCRDKRSTVKLGESYSDACSTLNRCLPIEFECEDKTLLCIILPIFAVSFSFQLFLSEKLLRRKRRRR